MIFKCDMPFYVCLDILSMPYGLQQIVCPIFFSILKEYTTIKLKVEHFLCFVFLSSKYLFLTLKLLPLQEELIKYFICYWQSCFFFNYEVYKLNMALRHTNT